MSYVAPKKVTLVLHERCNIHLDIPVLTLCMLETYNCQATLAISEDPD